VTFRIGENPDWVQIEAELLERVNQARARLQSAAPHHKQEAAEACVTAIERFTDVVLMHSYCRNKLPD
jgi:hypothetical protein